LAIRYSAVTTSGRKAASSNGEALGEAPDLLLGRPANDRHVDMQAARSGRLDDRRHAEALQAGAERAAPVSTTAA
jgi:hypothetical protein